MLSDHHENFIVRLDTNRPSMKRFYQLLRSADFYGQITWEFKLGLRAPELEWQGFIFLQDSLIDTLSEHIPAMQNVAVKYSLIPLLRILIRPSRPKRLKESLSFSTRRG